MVVAGGGGDNAASAAGIGVVAPGDAFLSLGTSGVLFVVNDRFMPNPKRAAHAFCHCLPGTWHQMAVILSAGESLQWVAALAGFADVPAAVEAARQDGPPRAAPLFLPYLSGERTPHNDPAARGVFFGLDAATGPADLVDAVLCGVALAFADGLEVLLEAGAAVGEISLCGGGSRRDHWAMLLASALRRPLTRRLGGEVGAALGAARLAQAALTRRIDAARFPAPPVDRIFEPDPGWTGWFGSRRPLFTRLYQSLIPLFGELPP
ncbi:MAG: FGGY-family carbohydrate kinase [Steroidobacteraceae bacterium]